VKNATKVNENLEAEKQRLEADICTRRTCLEQVIYCLHTINLFN